ncbi:hypothetical protein L2E82_16277 [Cichorium intybus]|uniref:Uncharacterized protein n=1 Tax=Cichorium intybus TaxID=13427 RepID=A0ACB9F5L6_CICIN|nr:hypothetical protein L2E82_16277 [Cichorium intybus]
MSSRTMHRGSPWCGLLKNASGRNRKNSNRELCQWNRLYVRRLALKNSLVRMLVRIGTVGTVERKLMKRAKASLIRPSSRHKSRRRRDFQPKPSRLSVMSKAGDLSWKDPDSHFLLRLIEMFSCW